MNTIYVITINDGGLTDLISAYRTKSDARDAFIAVLEDYYHVVFNEDDEDIYGEWDIDLYSMTADNGQIFIKVESVDVL